MGKGKEKKRLQQVEKAVYATLDRLEQHLLKEETDEEYIHRIRVHVKHLRAWLRLLKINVDEIYWKDMDGELRDLARSLGRARDLQVIAQTLDAFASRAENESERKALLKLHRTCDHEEVVNKIEWPAFKQALHEHIRDFREFYVHLNTVKDVRKDLMRHYKKTIQSALLAFADYHNFENLHRFRKDVKALNYQVGYLNKGFKNQGKVLKDQLDALGDLLGKVHDLDIVRLYIESLSGRRFNRNDRAITDKILERELQLLMLDARNIYYQIFDVTPKRFVSFLH